MNAIRQVLLTGTALFGSFFLLHAQTNAAQPSDSIVQLTADAQGLPLVSPDAVPTEGTFWVVTPGVDAANMAPWPCAPSNPSLPLYSIADGQFLVDATGGQVMSSSSQPVTSATINAALETLATSVVNLITQVQDTQLAQDFGFSSASAGIRSLNTMTANSLTPGDGGDDSGTNSYSPSDSSFVSATFSTNLWIAQWNINSGYLTGIASNTLADVPYEILTNTDLTTTNWGSTGLFIYGSEITNWTALPYISMYSTSNCLFKLRSWEGDGSGMPIWWQLQYFRTSGVDPYSNPKGDGYNNLYKFQNGMNPNVFYTPAAPIVTASFNANNSIATVSWLPSPGVVTNYLVNIYDYMTYTGTNFNVSPSTLSIQDNLAGDDIIGIEYNGDPTPYVDYSVQAQYAEGGSGFGSASIESLPATGVNLVTGGQGRLYCVFQNLPSDLSSVRIYRGQWNSYPLDVAAVNGMYGDSLEIFNTIGSPVNDGYFEISAANITNGICVIPDSQTPPYYAYNLWVQTVRSNGVASSWARPSMSDDAYYSAASRPFVDARSQLKDNLRFLLRAATINKPFAFIFGSGYGAQYFTWPTNYVFADCYYSGLAGYNYWTFSGIRPINDNYYYQNFLYNQNNLAPDGFLNTGVTASNSIISVIDLPTYYFNLSGFILATSPSVPDSQLASSLSQWILPSDADVNTLDGSSVTGMRNCYGLTNISEKVAYVTNNQLISATYYPGNALPSGVSGVNYFETAQPIFQTAGYYFARPGIDPMPEQLGFATTNLTPFMIQGVGSSQQIAGYAKLSLQNGYSGVYGYLGQYFNNAYKKDANGNVTANTTGILSQQGNFFAMEPGQVALVTMPDIDPPYQRGTCTVYAVSLQLDKNHDGTMDTTFNAPDVTSQASPMVCWVNNGNIQPGKSGSPDKDIEVLPTNPQYNYNNKKISCQRDLENFYRLWICGLPALPANQGYSVTLSMTPTSGNPAINLYWSCETNGGIGYLTDTNVAAIQSYIISGNGYGVSLGTVSYNSSFTFPDGSFEFGGTPHFLFEGAGIGAGQLTMTISQNGNTIAQSSVWLDLRDIKTMYEQAHIAGLTTSYPAMVQNTNASTFVPDNQLPTSLSESNQLIVFVHGWRIGNFDYHDFSETMFKRLYWQGYQGRFAALRWPTLSSDDYWSTGDLLSYTTFNRSEFNAHRSADGASAYFDWLKSRLPNYSINAVAHSMGNIVMMETMKLQLAAGSHDIDNYVMMQAAVPAQCYDTSLANYGLFTAAESANSSSHTPDIYRGFPGNIAAAVNGQIMNFFNTNDYALATGTKMLLNVSWEGNQVNFKPDGPWDYSSDGTNCYQNNAGFRTVADPREQMAFVARPRSKAAGALGGVGGVVQGGQLDLKGNFGFNTDSQDHSAEFNWNIQRLNGTNGFYQLLLRNLTQ